MADSETGSGKWLEEINAQLKGLGVEGCNRPIVKTITAEFDMKALTKADVYHYSGNKPIGDIMWKILVKRDTLAKSLRVGLRFVGGGKFEGRKVTQCSCKVDIRIVHAKDNDKTIIVSLLKSYSASGKEQGDDIIQLSELDDTNAGFQHNGKLKIEVNLMIYELSLLL